MEKIIKQLKEWDDAYNNNQPLVADSVYDELYFKLQEMEQKTGIVLPDSPTRKIRYEVKSDLMRIKHNHPMLSLAKTKNYNDFIAYFHNKEFIIMGKMDGLTCSLCYENGNLISAETRGDGEYGFDVLHNILTIKNVPHKIPYKDKLIIDGEIICTYEDFKPFEDLYSNPRNFASGSIQLLDNKECAQRPLKFIAWYVVQGFDSNYLSNKLCKLDELGFDTVPWTNNPEWIDMLKQNLKLQSYPIDGLVGRFNNIEYGNNLGATGHHRKDGFALKFEDDIVETELLDIEWSMGRTGILTPVAKFKKINLLDTEVEKASLHNISVMNNLGITHIGQTIGVYKANEIIPQIAYAQKGSGVAIDIPALCPFCGQPLKQKTENESTFLVCENELCPSRVVNSIDHYCGKSGLDIKGLSIATLEYLIDKGWVKNIIDLYNLEQYEVYWQSEQGWGPASVAKVIKSIKDNSTNVESWKFLSALGIPLVGKRMSKELMKTFNDFNQFLYGVENGFNFETLDGIGPEIANAIKNFNYTQAKEIINNGYVTFQDQDISKSTESKNTCSGLTFVVTGDLITGQWKNRNDLIASIESLGGKTSGSVSSKTSYLINNDINSTTGKNQKAKTLNIPIITEQEFIDKFL